MKRAQGWIAVIVFLLIVGTGCANRNDSPIVVTSREKEVVKIEALLKEQSDAWNRGDLDGFMAGYWDSPDLEFVSGTTTTKGYQPVKDRYFKRYKAEGKEMGTLTFSDIRVTVLGEGGAKATGKWKVAMSKESPSGGFALQLRMFDNGWKIVQDTTSSDEPPKKE